MRTHPLFRSSLLTALALPLLLGQAPAMSAGQIQALAQSPSFRSPDGLALIHLLLEPSEPGSAYLGRGTFLPGAEAPVHLHPESEEIVYVLSGEGTMLLGDREVVVQKDMAIRIPAGVAHSFRVTGEKPLEVVQVYSPAGPEQRFKDWKQVSPSVGEKKQP